MDIDLHQKHEVEKILVLFTEKLSEKWEVRWRNREEGGRWMRGEGERGEGGREGAGGIGDV